MHFSSNEKALTFIVPENLSGTKCLYLEVKRSLANNYFSKNVSVFSTVELIALGTQMIAAKQWFWNHSNISKLKYVNIISVRQNYTNELIAVYVTPKKGVIVTLIVLEN